MFSVKVFGLFCALFLFVQMAKTEVRLFVHVHCEFNLISLFVFLRIGSERIYRYGNDDDGSVSKTAQCNTRGH